MRIIGITLLSIIIIFIVSLMVRNGFFTEVDSLQRYAMYDVVAVPGFILLLFLTGNKINIKKSMIANIIIFISSLSYSFFLAQVFFVWKRTVAISSWLNITHNCIKYIIALALCFFITILFHFGVEVPMRSYIKKREK